MLTGIELGKAIDSARKLKGVSKAEMARHFRVQPPSVSGWISTGRIDKKKLSELFDYFQDVAGPDHWGLGSHAGWLYREDSTEAVRERPAEYFLSDRYNSATEEHRRAVDALAKRLLDVSPEQALTLQKAMELLIPTDESRKD